MSLNYRRNYSTNLNLQNSKKKNVKIRLLVFLFLAGFLWIGWILFRDASYFEVERIFIDHKSISLEEQKVLLSPFQKGQNLYLLDLKVLQRQLKLFYFRQAIAIEREYPNILWIELSGESVPVAYVEKVYVASSLDHRNSRKTGEKEYFLVPSEGEPILLSSESSFQEFPKMDTVPWIFQEEGSTPSLESVLISLKKVKSWKKEFPEKIQSIFLFQNSKNNYFLLQNQTARFYFGGELSLFHWMQAYSLIPFLEEKEEKGWKVLDLRFDPIVAR